MLTIFNSALKAVMHFDFSIQSSGAVALAVRSDGKSEIVETTCNCADQNNGIQMMRPMAGKLVVY